MTNVDIIVKAYDQASNKLTGVTKNLLGIGDSSEIAQKKMAILGTVTTATIAIIAESYKTYQKLAESVRDLSLVSGQSAEETSRFIQVLDDYQLTAEDATVAAKKLKEQGLTPTTETLARLADEFKKIEDPALRLQFVQENLGKGGAKWVNILNQGGDALRDLSSEIDKNLILSEHQIKMYEIQRLAIDSWMDKAEAFKVQLGANTGNVIAYTNAMVRATQIQNENTEIIGGQKRSTIEYSKALEMAIAEQLEAVNATTQQGDALIELEIATKAAEDALKDLSKANAELISGAISITEENNKYKDSQQEIADQIAELQAEKSTYYSWEIDKIQSTEDKIQDLSNKYNENAEDFAESMQKKFALMAIEQIALSDGIEGYSQAEYEKARAILETTDIATAAAFEQMQSQTLLSQAVADGQVSVEQWGSILSAVMADGVVSVNEVTNAINAVPRENTITFTYITTGDLPDAYLQSERGGRPEGRANGGQVSGGKMYEVTEGNMPELLQANGKQYLMMPPNQSGNVIPSNGMSGSSGGISQDAVNQIVSAIYSTRIDMYDFARIMTQEAMRNER